jgi:hypothetical protein
MQLRIADVAAWSERGHKPAAYPEVCLSVERHLDLRPSIACRSPQPHGPMVCWGRRLSLLRRLIFEPANRLNTRVVGRTRVCRVLGLAPGAAPRGSLGRAA